MRKLLLRSVVLAACCCLQLINTSTLFAASVTVTVPGTSDMWLAGMPDGSRASSIDRAPAQSPIRVLMTLLPGMELTFSSTGWVNNMHATSGYSGDGNPGWITPHDVGSENGMSNARAPMNAVMGVFLGPAQPGGSTPPPALDFSTANARDYSSLSPLLRQIFFIGNGLTSGGVRQRIVVPAGATRLFLGTMDSYGWSDNSGSFSVTVVSSADDPPTVEYDGSTTPDTNLQPFVVATSGTGSSSVSAGILTMNVTSSTGSLNNERYDPLSDSDFAVFQFRMRLTRVGQPAAGTIPGGVVQVRWGGQSGAFLFFATDGQIILEANSSPAPVQTFSKPLDTTLFHTYTVVKNGNQNIKVYVDGEQVFDRLVGDFSHSGLSGWQSFGNNPDSSTEWDYFKYAIGPNALALIPVPIRSTIAVTSPGARVHPVTEMTEISGHPANFSVSRVISFTATEVTGSARFSVAFPALPSDPVFYKVVGETWKQLYPVNECKGVTNVDFSDTTLSFTMAENSDCNGTTTPGRIVDPLVAGNITPSGGGGGGGGTGCFIATAAYGSSLHPYVAVLREFRDKVLLASRPGAAFVEWYYRVSPPIAETLSRNAPLKAGVRILLLPLIGFSWLVLKIGPAWIAALLLLCLLAACTAAHGRNRLNG